MKKIYITIIGLALIASAGCKKYLDVNTDPATPQNAESRTLTPPLFAQMERGIQFDSRYLGPLIQNWGYRTSSYVGAIHGWIPGSDSMGEIWRSNYYGLGSNLSLIMEHATATEQYNYLGMAQAIRAWSWQVTTDYHGDIILKEAFQANRYVFDYDPQSDVYAEVVRLANESIANFSRTDGSGTVAKMSAADLVYHGDNAKWIKFNYGILARNMNNLVNKASYDPNKVIEYVDKSLSSNADNFATPNFGSNTTDASFYGPIRGNLNSYRVSDLMVGLLDGTYLAGTAGAVMDPRINTLITPSNDGVFRGTKPGLGDPVSSTAQLAMAIPNPWGSVGTNAQTPSPGAGGGKYIFKDNADMPIMTYAEMQFIKAEAAFRANKMDVAFAAYRNGISAHIDFVSGLGTAISSAAKTAYLASASVKQTMATLTMKDIMLQKYIALYGFGFVETWSDLRKFNYANGDAKGNNPYLNVYVLPTVLYSDNGGKPGMRYRPRYNSEYLWNLDALKKIGGDQPDYHTYPMWFAQP